MESDKIPRLIKSIILGNTIERNKSDEQSYLRIKGLVYTCMCSSFGKLQTPNEKQMHALEMALTQDFSLIQGPPGTGKTVTGIILAHCFAQMNRRNSKGRVMYCSPSNKAVDVIGRFLKKRFFEEKSKGNFKVSSLEDEIQNKFEFSFTRVYSERIASAEYPQPKYFDKLLNSSPKLNDGNTISSESDTNHSDPELIDYILHHVIRKEGKPYADKLKVYDRKFSILREYEDRVRNRYCCCGTSIENFRPYNFRVCKHARYFEHPNKSLQLDRLLREDTSYADDLKRMDNELTILKFYLRRKFDPLFEPTEYERNFVKMFSNNHSYQFESSEQLEILLKRSELLEILNRNIPDMTNNINVSELFKWFETFDIDENHFYNILLGRSIRIKRELDYLSALKNRMYAGRDYVNDRYFLEFIQNYDQRRFGIAEIFKRQFQYLKMKLNEAHSEEYEKYKRFMSQAASFTWEKLARYEELMLSAELELFEREVSDNKENEDDSETYTDLLHEAYSKELENHDIVLSTCIAVSTSVLREEKNFKQLIIDEAGMTKEPEALVPILLCRPDKIVLIGDHKQLRSIVKSQNARELGLERSLFERYCEKVTMLLEQYRMHVSICEFPSISFYKKKLITRANRPESAIHWPSKDIRVVFIDVKGVENKLSVHSSEGSENSVRNDIEIGVVEKLFKYLAEDRTKNNLIESKDIKILTQYRAQVKGIMDKLNVTDERVSTVITSQGGEWDYVILSLVRSIPDCDIDKRPTDGWRKKYLGFICDQNQMNVALTRARKGLFIIGNKNLLKCDKTWNNLIKLQESRNSIMTIDQFLSYQMMMNNKLTVKSSNNWL